MTITATFNDFEEMQAFAAKLATVPEAEKYTLKDSQESAPGAPAAAAPIMPAVPTTPMGPTVPQAPITPPAVDAAAAATAVPVTTPTYALEDLTKAAMTLMDAGRQNDLIALLNKFGVSSLPDLPAAYYGAFATDLRGLGAQI